MSKQLNINKNLELYKREQYVLVPLKNVKF